MRLFKKNNKTSMEKVEDTILSIEDTLFNARREIKACEDGIERLKTSLPDMVRDEIMSLMRNKAIKLMCTYRDEEIYISVVADKVKELKHKKIELEKALAEAEKALKTVGERLDEVKK